MIAAIDAFAERLRSQADHVPATARRADALVALVNAAHATGSIPSRGGLPVSVSVVMDTTATGEVVCTSSRGHALTSAEQRFTTCDALITPIQIDAGTGPDPVIDLRDTAGRAHAELVRGAASEAGLSDVVVWVLRRWGCGPDRGPGSGSVRQPDPVGRRPDSPNCHPSATPGVGHPRWGLHHPGLWDTGRSVSDAPRPRLGRRWSFGPAQSGPALLGTSPSGRSGHVDHQSGPTRPADSRP